MSQVKSPYGLSYVKYKGGKDKMATSVYPLNPAAVAIGQGDAVTMCVQGGTAGLINSYIPPVAPVTAGCTSPSTAILGVAVSFSWVNLQGQLVNNQPYWPGPGTALTGTAPYITVADLVSNVYQIQCSGTLSLTAPATIIGKNYNLLYLTPNTPNSATGQSQQALDVQSYVAPGTAGTTTANYWLSLKVVGLGTALQSGQTNSWQDSYPDVLVMINSHSFKPGTQGI